MQNLDLNWFGLTEYNLTPESQILNFTNKCIAAHGLRFKVSSIDQFITSKYFLCGKTWDI